MCSTAAAGRCCREKIEEGRDGLHHYYRISCRLQGANRAKKRSLAGRTHKRTSEGHILAWGDDRLSFTNTDPKPKKFQSSCLLVFFWGRLTTLQQSQAWQIYPLFSKRDNRKMESRPPIRLLGRIFALSLGRCGAEKKT